MSVRAYFDRIQGRLFLGFVLTFLGTLTIYIVSVVMLNAFTDEVSDRINTLYSGTQAAAELESAEASAAEAAERSCDEKEEEQITAGVADRVP